MKPAYLIILLVMNFFWSGVYVAYKIIDHCIPSDSTTGLIVTLRFGISALCILALWPWLPGASPRGMDLLKTGIMGCLVFVVEQRLQVYANQMGSAGNSAMLMAVEPIIGSAAAAVFLHEPIGPRRLAGFALGISGVALLNRIWRPDFQWTGTVPSLIFISSFLCGASYSVMGKPIIARAGMMKVLGLALAAATPVNLLIDGRTTFAAARHLSLEAWLLILGLAIVCTVIGYTVWFLAIRDAPINVASLTIFTQAIFGIAIAAVWLGEKPHWGQFFGGVTILAGIALGLSRQMKPEDATPASGAAPNVPD